VGFSLGWFAMVVLAAFRSAAVLVSDQIGFSLGGVLDPLSQGGEHVLRAFYGLFAVFVFVSVDMHHEFLRGFSESFQVLPAGTFLEGGLGDLLQRLVLLGGWHLFELTLRVALPVLAMLLLASAVQGILARIIPELEFLVFGFPLRTFAGLGVCVLSLPWLAALLRGLFSGACDQGRSLVRTLAG
jgi:flagellar biosynthetic protein FliR